MALPHSILIVGGGVFGLSTALALSTRYPNNETTLIESAPTIPNPHGSSVDSSRIVRADYANPAYARLATAALHQWRTTEWGHEGRYTENGLVFVFQDGNSAVQSYVQKSYENLKAIRSEKEKVNKLSHKELETLLSQYGVGENFAGGYLNKGSGWSNAEAGVRFARKKLENSGRTVFRTGKVERILFSDLEEPGGNENQVPSQKASGVCLTDGSVILADLIVLATGAWTPQLIDLRGKVAASGQVLTYLRITDDEQQRLKDMPTFLNFGTGIFVIPPRDNILKIGWHSHGYHNPKRVPIPGPVICREMTMEISVPEDGLPVPFEGQKYCRDALKGLLPALEDRPFCRTRVCWYSDTPKGDFLITYHPNHPNLFLATGDSGHGYKFFPILGDKIVDALEEKLEPELQKLWRWQSDSNTTENGPLPTLTKMVEEGTNDGSRCGRKGLILAEELAMM